MAEETGEGSVGQQPPSGLARGAVVCLVRGIDDTLDGRATVWAGVSVSAVHRHALVKGAHLVGETLTGLVPQPRDPV